MVGYYDEGLAAERLERCYDLAPPRVRRYLEAEITHVLARVRQGNRVLELGCGYGRVLKRLVDGGALVTGIDTSLASLALARRRLGSTARLAQMDACHLAFTEGGFDLVVCIQNGISAFHRDPRRVVSGAIRATRPGGRVLFSSYSERFWPDRLEWFRIQASEGLIGAIDEDRTSGGVIVCADGFTATTFTRADFERLAGELSSAATVTEVDGSSIFCEMRV